MGKSRHTRRFRGANKPRKSGIAKAEDVEARKKSAIVGGISSVRKVRPDMPKFTAGQVDNRLKDMAESRELTKPNIIAMNMPIDEIAWRQANNLMPVEISGGLPASPFLVTQSVVHKKKNRLMSPHEEANYNLTMSRYFAKKPKGNPKQLNSKAQKAAHEERVSRSPIQVN